MDLNITGTIVSAILTGAAKVGQSIVTDSYNALKKLIEDKYQNTSLPSAISNLEALPDSGNRQGVLQEEIEITKADKDPDIVKAIQALMEALDKTPEGREALGKFSINAKNVQSVVQAERIDTLTQNFGKK